MNRGSFVLGMMVVGLLLSPAPVKARPRDPAEPGANPPRNSGSALESGKRRISPASPRWLRTTTRKLDPRLKLKPRIQKGKQRFLKSKAGKVVRRAAHKTRRVTHIARARLTGVADRLEHGLPGPAQGVLSGLRRYNPLSFPAYSLYKFGRDPLFLGTYKGLSSIAGKLAPALLVRAGLGVSASFLIPSLLGTPIDLAFIVGREHHLRADRSQSLLGTLRHMVQEYRSFVDRRREQNRRYLNKLNASANQHKQNTP